MTEKSPRLTVVNPPSFSTMQRRYETALAKFEAYRAGRERLPYTQELDRLVYAMDTNLAAMLATPAGTPEDAAVKLKVSTDWLARTFDDWEKAKALFSDAKQAMLARDVHRAVQLMNVACSLHVSIHGDDFDRALEAARAALEDLRRMDGGAP